jgi:hypothetical protein
MPDIFRFNKEMEQYIHTLPVEMQQKIRQSNAKIGCVEDLRQMVEQVQKSDEP